MFIVCVNVHACMDLCPQCCGLLYVGRGEGECMCVVCQRHILPTVICCRLILCHVNRMRNQITTNLNCPARAFIQIFKRKHECTWAFRSDEICFCPIHVHSPLSSLLMEKCWWQCAGLVWVGGKNSWHKSNLTNLKLTVASQNLQWFGSHCYEH